MPPPSGLTSFARDAWWSRRGSGERLRRLAQSCLAAEATNAQKEEEQEQGRLTQMGRSVKWKSGSGVTLSRNFHRLFFCVRVPSLHPLPELLWAVGPGAALAARALALPAVYMNREARLSQEPAKGPQEAFSDIAFPAPRSGKWFASWRRLHETSIRRGPGSQKKSR